MYAFLSERNSLIEKTIASYADSTSDCVVALPVWPFPDEYLAGAS